MPGPAFLYECASTTEQRMFSTFSAREPAMNLRNEAKYSGELT